jgi:hypothetical protein
MVVDNLPDGTQFVSVTESQGSCSFSTVSGHATVTCDLGTLASGATATVTIKVRPTATGSITNNASATSDTADPDDEDNDASATTRVTA